jgi:hypothetical protein
MSHSRVFSVAKFCQILTKNQDFDFSKKFAQNNAINFPYFEGKIFQIARFLS